MADEVIKITIGRYEIRDDDDEMTYVKMNEFSDRAIFLSSASDNVKADLLRGMSERLIRRVIAKEGNRSTVSGS